MSVIRQQSLVNLLAEYSNNRYTTYPYGFYRNIELNTKKNEAMEKLLSALTGMSIEKIKSIQSFSESGHSAIEGDKVLFPEEVDEVVNSTKNNITDDDYLNLMDKVDQLLGGGSPYSKRLIASRFGRIPKSYEEALQEYNDMLYKDKITVLLPGYFVIMQEWLDFYLYFSGSILVSGQKNKYKSYTVFKKSIFI